MVLAAGHWPCDHFSATRSMFALTILGEADRSAEVRIRAYSFD